MTKLCYEVVQFISDEVASLCQPEAVVFYYYNLTKLTGEFGRPVLFVTSFFHKTILGGHAKEGEH